MAPQDPKGLEVRYDRSPEEVREFTKGGRDKSVFDVLTTLLPPTVLGVELSYLTSLLIPDDELPAVVLSLKELPCDCELLLHEERSEYPSKLSNARAFPRVWIVLNMVRGQALFPP